jgi:hypothetical protein
MRDLSIAIDFYSSLALIGVGALVACLAAASLSYASFAASSFCLALWAIKAKLYWSYIYIVILARISFGFSTNSLDSSSTLALGLSASAFNFASAF